MTALKVTGLAALVALAMVAPACADDEKAADSDKSAATTQTTTNAVTDADGATVAITAKNFEFVGVPPTIAAGSRISLTTEAGGEPHEFVLVKRPDGETRPLTELLELPESELETIFAGEPALVTIAMPGQTDTPGPVLGDARITEPGEYIYICTFPQGTTVDDVANATGPLQGDTPPHFVFGMAGELTVE